MRVLHRKCLLQISRNDYLFRLAEVETCSQNLNENRHCWVRTYPSVNLALCVPKKSSLSKRDLGTARSLARVLPDIGANTILYSLLCIFYRLTPSPEWPMLKSSCTLLPKVFSDFTLPHRHTHTFPARPANMRDRGWAREERREGREWKGRGGQGGRDIVLHAGAGTGPPPCRVVQEQDTANRYLALKGYRRLAEDHHHPYLREVRCMR